MRALLDSEGSQGEGDLFSGSLRLKLEFSLFAAVDGVSLTLACCVCTKVNICGFFGYVLLNAR